MFALDASALESLADRVLAGTALDDDAAFVPFVGAALQVYFARLAPRQPSSSLRGSLVDGTRSGLHTQKVKN